MRVLIGSNVHWWNAEAAYAATVAELLQEHGHEVWVLTRSNTLNESQLQQRKLRILTHIDLNTHNPFRIIFSFFKLRAWIQRHQIEIVNPHRSEGFGLYVLVKWSLGTFKLIRTRGTTKAIKNHGLNRQLYQKWLDSIITPSQIVVQRLLEKVPISQERIHTIYYPTVLPRLPLLVKLDYRKEFQIPQDHLVLAIVGRTSPVKGHQLLFSSYQKLVAQKAKVSLLIIYKEEESHPEVQQVQQDAKELGIFEHLRWIGQRKDLLEIMQFVDLGIVSSLDSEVICRVTVEFFSVATPVLAFAVGALPEIITHQVNGYVVPSITEEALTKQLFAITNHPSELNELGKKARLDAENKYSKQRFYQETFAVYSSLLESTDCIKEKES